VNILVENSKDVDAIAPSERNVGILTTNINILLPITNISTNISPRWGFVVTQNSFYQHIIPLGLGLKFMLI
jgi:hypothetical protein